MSRSRLLKSALVGSACAFVLASAAAAQAPSLDVPAGDLAKALDAYITQSGVQLVYRVDDVRGRRTEGVRGTMEPEQALSILLAGANLRAVRDATGALAIAQAGEGGSGPQSGGADVDALIVTAQKREENIQDVPIAISAFSQEDLTTRQVAGGPDLITQVPNFSFTKTNFSSYSIQIRGIGTQAISATTDPAVAVAFNNTPFIRNRFFEQEFYDLERLEILRGPQGTLYGRNATAGVVNIISAKPKFTYEARLSGDVGNYGSTRIEGMVNIPLVEDAVALRIAGAWTKRDGYATNQFTGQQIDGRDLWSTRASLRFEPVDWFSANFIYEHFEENDDRLRSGKQLCKKDLGPATVNGVPVPAPSGNVQIQSSYLSQGCLPVSLYSAEAFQTPNGFSLPFYGPTRGLGNHTSDTLDPYRSATQSRDLRVIESSVEPDYRAKSDVAELQFAVDLSDSLTLNSETAYSSDFLWSLQDYNRFTTTPHAFLPSDPNGFNLNHPGLVDANGVFCDPQLGCSDRLLLVDLSTERSTQFSQEFRLASDFDGPLNFSLGANYLRHDVDVKYYVFINSLSMLAGSGPANAEHPYVGGVTDNAFCQRTVDDGSYLGLVGDLAPYYDPTLRYSLSFNPCIYIDPNPIGSLNDQGRNYFLSKNPYKLISYAAFGEVYYNITENLKLTGGLRFTVDRKTAPQIPSWLLAVYTAGDYPTAQTVFQEWKEPTGRLALDWKPELGFTDDTLVYASYAHGYKAGGANPPPPVLAEWGDSSSGANVQELIPDTFGPEFVDAFELGTKNTLFGGALTLNLTGFYYDYEGYQVSEIRNRSAVNSNYDARIWGGEIEADWRITEALRLGFKGGYENTRIADGMKAVDLMDRTAGTPGWIVIRPFPTIPSNCIIPERVAGAGGVIYVGSSATSASTCVLAYVDHVDPVTGQPYNPSITNYVGQPCNRPGCVGGVLGSTYANYQGFDPYTAPNNGRGFDKQLGGNELPNAPNYTATLTADYTVPLAGDWLLNLHGDYHYQGESWARVFNSDPYDRIEAFSTVNLSAIFTNDEAGWKVMAYVKNAFDETAITGAFLNSDDTGLTTNVFLTEPRLYGVRVTKDFNGDGWLGDFGQRREGPYALTVEIGAGTDRFSTEAETYAPAWLGLYSPTFPLDQSFQDEDADWGDTRSLKLTYAPSADWRVSAAYRFGKTKGFHKATPGYEHVDGGLIANAKYPAGGPYLTSDDNHWRAAAHNMEEFTIADFMVGMDLGFGAFGSGGKSAVGLGLRYADIHSTSSVAMDGVPNRVVPPVAEGPFPARTLEAYTTTLANDRGFEGLGPLVSWDASLRLFGDEERGHVDVDWSVGGGVLFGKQTLDSNEIRVANRYVSIGGNFVSPVTPPIYNDVVPRPRSDDVTVPNLSLTLGLSYSIDRVKMSTGYSYDRFFDVIDAGYKSAEQYDRTIHGPYLKLSIGFGG